MIACVAMACLVVLNILMPPLPTPQKINSDNKEESKKTIATVTIDPGHGGYDDGSLGLNDELEKDITLSIAKKVQANLEEQQVKVVMTRRDDQVSWPSDNEKDLETRLQIAKKNKSEMFVSIHCNNSEFEPESVSGSEIYVNPNQSDSMNLARDINAQLQKLLAKLDNRGIKTDMDFHLIRFNSIPSVIVEVGFMTNSKDLELMSSESGQQIIAKAIADGILKNIKK